MSDSVATSLPEGVSASPRGRGRPTKFTPQTQATILDSIRKGFHMEPACQAAGVTYAAFREWMIAGEAGDPRYVDFFENVQLAEAEAEQTLVGRILDASETDWRPAGWILSRRFPDRYAEQRRGQVVHTGEITVKHEHLLTGLDLDAVRGLLQPPTDPTIIEGSAREVPPNES
jgi:hypothetical protein